MFKHDKDQILINTFPIASKQINALMPALLACLELPANAVLRAGLEMAAFLTTQLGEACVTLYYSRVVDPPEVWLQQAKAELVPALGGASIVARCKGGERSALLADAG